MSIAELIREPLSVFNINPDDVLPHVTLDDPEALLLLTGTFAQGLATPTSDIDFLLIYPHDRQVDGLRRHGNAQKPVPVFPIRAADASFPMDNILVINRETERGRKIQTYVTSIDYVEEVQDLVRARNDSFRRRIKDSTAQRREGCLIDRNGHVILHRFYTGKPLHNAPRIEIAQARLPLSEIAVNLAIRETTEIQCYFSDIQGLTALSTPDLDAITFILDRIHFHLAVVLLAAIGEISPREKLVYRLLKRHRDKIDSGVVDRFFASLYDVRQRAKNDPRSIENFVNKIILENRHIPELVAREYEVWTAESQYIPYELKSA